MSMDEGRIVLVGNETDILHSGYSHTISHDNKRYPSAVHFTHSMILSTLAVDENAILDLLCAPSIDVPRVANQLLQENMPPGHTMESLAEYIRQCKQSYTMKGLTIRAEQDKVFERTLMNTKDALIIVCDPKDRDMGIGMDENRFIEWMGREKADIQMLTYWMRNEHNRHPDLGANNLGHYLMWIRYQRREDKKAAMLRRLPQEVDGVTKNDDDVAVRIKLNEAVISLTGIFRPLSNYYPLPFEMKGERYRSVEHYAYEKLFNALKLDDKMIEKLQTTVSPIDIPVVAERIFNKLDMEDKWTQIEAKLARMDRWRQSAMKHKILQNNYLQQLLLSTGDALLIDTSPGDPTWTCQATESEIQHLLTKDYVTPAQLVNWMKSTKVPVNLQGLRGDKTGLVLMELRQKYAQQTESRIPLISPLVNPTFASMVTQHVICFTAESVWHPLYPAEIRPTPDSQLIPSPMHFVAQQAIKYLGINQEDREYIMETKSSVECWQRLHEVIEEKGRGLEREQQWWMEVRQKAIKDALQLLLEQHSPLLRALLDTGDAMLVYCSRFSSAEAELSIGMRESDLRNWMHTVDISSKQLLELCCRPMAFRPPYLGGNRLGIILMELRREFVLKGVFPHILPELNIGVDVILGTDSPTENLVVDEPFDILSPDNYTALWINPLMLLVKDKDKKDDSISDLISAAYFKKLPPRLVTVDDTKINEILEQITQVSTNELSKRTDRRDYNQYLSDIAPEDLRAVFMKMCTRLRSRLGDIEFQQQEMQYLAVEVNRMQMIRRSLDTVSGNDPLGQTRVGPGPIDLMREPSGMGGMPPPLIRATGGQERRRDDRGEDRRRMDYGRSGGTMQGQKRVRRDEPAMQPTGSDDRRRNTTDRRSSSQQRFGRSPTRSRNRNEVSTGPFSFEQSSYQPVANRAQSPKPESAKQEVAPPKPKIPKPRPPDEELSEGEILSSDED
ncbi:hypothetical protein WR25_21389 [Diploscapter pachys]|uniref:NADAR domain-containing protein n=1 Tax=Diploscapter pachys TaxID=2018661 RepID=A0A2A2JCG8_9BILA|nr:hypothetical protein WR25_21389 [Diploscapter pachys]